MARKKKGGAKDKAVKGFFLFVGVIAILAFAGWFWQTGGNISESLKPEIAIVKISGLITVGEQGGIFGSEGASSDIIVRQLKQAKKDNNIKAVILEINSPGGTAVASEEIARAVEDVKESKPVVAWGREVMASGGYWIASAANKIVVEETTLTGSIGVISSYLQFAGFMEEYGIEYERIVSGEYKDTGTPFREPSQEELRVIQLKVDTVYELFIKKVSERRGLDPAFVRKLATGNVYLGIEAFQNGLVDYLGGKDKAIKVAEELAGIEDSHIVEFRRPKTLVEILLGVFDNHFYMIGRGIGDSFRIQEEPLVIWAR